MCWERRGREELGEGVLEGELFEEGWGPAVDVLLFACWKLVRGGGMDGRWGAYSDGCDDYGSVFNDSHEEIPSLLLYLPHAPAARVFVLSRWEVFKYAIKCVPHDLPVQPENGRVGLVMRGGRVFGGDGEGEGGEEVEGGV